MPARTVLIACVLIVCGGRSALAQLTVTFDATPQPVQYAGYPTILEATATHSGTEEPVYQFAYRTGSADWTIVRDFYRGGRFEWATLDEGAYELRVTARLVSTNETAH